MGSKRRSKRRDTLFNLDPHCRFCGVEMIHPSEFFINGKLKNPPDNMLTLEHLDSKFSEMRGKYKNQARTTICCYKCNTDRNNKEMAQIPKERLWERCSSYPLNYTETTKITNG